MLRLITERNRSIYSDKISEVHLYIETRIKYLEQEEVVKSIPAEELVKGNYSKRTYDFLKGGGNIHHVPMSKSRKK